MMRAFLVIGDMAVKILVRLARLCLEESWFLVWGFGGFAAGWVWISGGARDPPSVGFVL